MSPSKLRFVLKQSMDDYEGLQRDLRSGGKFWILKFRKNFEWYERVSENGASVQVYTYIKVLCSPGVIREREELIVRNWTGF